MLERCLVQPGAETLRINGKQAEQQLFTGPGTQGADHSLVLEQILGLTVGDGGLHHVIQHAGEGSGFGRITGRLISALPAVQYFYLLVDGRGGSGPYPSGRKRKRSTEDGGSQLVIVTVNFS